MRDLFLFEFRTIEQGTQNLLTKGRRQAAEVCLVENHFDILNSLFVTLRFKIGYAIYAIRFSIKDPSTISHVKCDF